MKQLKQLLVVMLLFCTQQIFAQSRIISGKVMDANGSPVSGASVKIKGSNKGTITEADGSFKLSASAKDQLEISGIGFQPQTVSAANNNISVTLAAAVAEVEQVVLVGSRRGGRVKLETPVPVDVLNVGQATQSTAKMDLTSIMNYAAPSFNYNKQSGSDGADHIDLATLRGLGPDQTLVLINGKRRHQTAFVAVFGTRGRGNSGTDLNAIPVSAIDRVEILRDGASAQYGSDAIAGVINIVLKESVKKFSLNVGYSSYYDQKFNPAFKPEIGEYIYGNKLDGTALNVGANYGLPIGKKGGFINLSGNYWTNGKTYRQVLESNDLSKEYSLPINIYRRAHGDGSLDAFGGMFNSEVPLNGGITFYSFGGYNHKSSDAYAFTRNFSARPDRFVTDAGGNIVDVPGIIMTSASGEQFYNPHIQTKIDDGSLALGVKGTLKNGWAWDLSNNVGYNKFHYYGDKTFNASSGDATKNHFDDGGFSFMQNTSNLNFSKGIKGIGKAFNLAAGLEFRFENYKIFAGEEGSYKNYDPLGEKASGSQGFPGFQPSDVVNATRTTLGAYIDAEMDVTDDFLVGGAVRVENYSDFGFTHNYKLSSRLKISPQLNLRGSISTGFRAPSLQQINFSSTFTTVQGGQLAEVKIAPNYSTIAKAAGIPDLKQEKSLNGSIGFAWKPSSAFNMTVDGYWVNVKDRVVLSGQFDGSDPRLDPALAAEMAALNVSLAQFFANAVNTTNKGVDIVADYSKRWGNKRLKILAAANFQNMSIDKVNVPAKLANTANQRATFLSDREKAFILASAPKSKFSLTFEYGIKKLTIGTRFTHFGAIDLLGYGEDGLGINPMVPTDGNPNVYVPDAYHYAARLINDWYCSYPVHKHATLYLGVDNLWNVHPSLGAVAIAKGWAYNNETGGPWDAVQMGGNGLRFFGRLSFSF
jgi:iron complex outermembrane receptor protein